MARFKMRLVQQTTEEGSGDFTLEADSPEAAAAILNRAWKVAMAQGSSLVRLPDGQVQLIERSDIIARRVSFVLLDERGEEVREVTPPNGHAP